MNKYWVETRLNVNDGNHITQSEVNRGLEDYKFHVLSKAAIKPKRLAIIHHPNLWT